MSNKEYVRDKRSPLPKNEAVSRVMSANKRVNSKPEVALRKALREKGLTGYRLNYKKVPGSPDICFVSKKVAIFVHGCYWHRCPHCNLPLPKHNQEFWKEKFSKNIVRDQKKIEQLMSLDWQNLVVWECEIKRDTKAIIAKISKLLNKVS